MGQTGRDDLKRSEIVKLLGICAELNFIFREEGVNFSKGIAFVADGGEAEDLAESLVRNIGAARFTKLKYGKNAARNYQMAVHLYARSDKEDEIHNFMDSKNFLPAIVVGGVMPECLREISYGVRVDKKMVNGIREPGFAEEQQEIRDFVRENPDFVSRELELVRTSLDFRRREEYSSLFTGLLAASKIYQLFYRGSHSEAETYIYTKKVQEEVGRCVDEADEFAGGYDAADAIIKAICQYLASDSGWEIGDVRDISGDLYKAIKNKSAILYDDQHYYIAEPFLKKACGAILGALSFLKVKNIMWEEGIIVCNENNENNFTVKKILYDECGVASRERFIKMNKEFFLSDEGLYLEEMK